MRALVDHVITTAFTYLTWTHIHPGRKSGSPSPDGRCAIKSGSAKLDQPADGRPIARRSGHCGRGRAARPGEHTAQFAAWVPVWSVQVDRAAEHPGLVPAAFLPH